MTRLKIRAHVILFACGVLIGVPDAGAQTQVFEFPGPGSGSGFGRTVQGGSDVDADGIPDFVVGAPFDNANGAQSGSVHAFSGRDGAELWHRPGFTPANHLGRVLSGAGDLDFDGHDDVLVGGEGFALVLSGADASVIRFFTDPVSLTFATAVAAIGDVDFDGVSDVAFGDPEFAGRQGRLVVMSGATSAVIHDIVGTSTTCIAGTKGEELGRALAAAGDVNLDGIPDIVAGAPGYAVCGFGFGAPIWTRGRTYVLSGSDGSVLQMWEGVFNDSYILGRVVAGADDVDADGYPDILIGLPPESEARAYSGADGSLLGSVTGPATFGSVLGAAGDVDGDGFGDVMVAGSVCVGGGLFCGFMPPGFVRIYSGATGLVIHQFTGVTGDGFGASVSNAGDIDGDGYPDALIGGDGRAAVFTASTLPAAAAAPLGGTCWPAPGPTLAATPPRLGDVVSFDVHLTLPMSVGYLFLGSPPPAPVPVMAGPTLSDPCFLYVDPMNLASVISFAGTGGSWSLILPLASVPTFAGVAVSAQAALFSSSGGIALTNAITGTLGY